MIATGATQLRTHFTAEQLPGVIKTYMSGLKVAYAIAIAVAGISVLITPLVPIRKLDPKKIGPGAA